MSVEIYKEHPWITEELLTVCLRQLESSARVQIKTVDGSSPLASGENYCSDIIRIIIKYSIHSGNVSMQKETSFILKASIPNKECVKLSKIYEFFPKEICIYKILHPVIEDRLKSIGIECQIEPRYLACDENLSAILFVDLSLHGYQSVDKRFGLDFEHFKVALKKLAWWHATTALLLLKEKDLCKLFLRPAMRPEMSTADALLTNVLISVTKVAKKWSGYERISEIMLLIKDKLFKRICKDFVYVEKDFNIITHGDIWSNNIMYKYNENGQPVDAIMVDFTVGCRTSPGRDLTYLLFSSFHHSIGEREWDFLLQYYTQELTYVLNRLEYPRKIPTLNDIQVSFLNGGLYSALYGFFITGLRFSEETNGDGLLPFISNSKSDEEFRFRMYSNPDCEQSLKFLLNYFDRKGFFDI